MASTRRIRWVLWSGLGLLVAAVILAIVTFRYGLDAYRGEIERMVEQSTGRPFHLRGRLELRLAPLIGIEAGPAELAEPPGMPGPPFASWRSASFRLRLRPLLHHRVVVDRVRIDGLEVHLRRDADGRTNWSDLARPGGATVGSEGSAANGAIELDGLEVRDGLVDFADGTSGTRARLSAVRLDLGRSHFARRIEVGQMSLAGRLASSVLPAGVRGSQDSPAVPVRVGLAGLTVIPTPREVIVPGWSLDIADAQARGSLAARETSDAGGGAAAWRARGPISVSIASVHALAETLGIEAPKTADPRAFGALQLTGDWSFANGALTVESLRTRLDDTTLVGRLACESTSARDPAGHGTGIGPRIEVDLHGDRIDLGRYFPSRQTPGKALQLPVAALRALRIEGSVALDEARYGDVEMRNVRLAMPPARASGTVRKSRP